MHHLLVVSRVGVLLLFIGTQVLMLLEPTEVHRVPLLVPNLLQELRRPLCNGAVLISLELINSFLLLVIEDAVASPDASNRLIEIRRLQDLESRQALIDLVLSFLRFNLLSGLFSDRVLELREDQAFLLQKLISLDISQLACLVIDSVSQEELEVRLLLLNIVDPLLD